MSKTVRTLLRVSSKQQLHDDDIPVQRAEVEQFINQHPDWEFDKEYIEKAISLCVEYSNINGYGFYIEKNEETIEIINIIDEEMKENDSRL